MKVCTIVFGVLAACAVSLAAEHGPVLTALQPAQEQQPQELLLVEPTEGNNRQKRGLLLGLLGAKAIGAGVLGAGILGAGAVGAGILGAKAVGAGFVGGALASRSFGGGYGYGGYGGYGYGGYGYGGYGHVYRSYPVTYW